VILLHGVIIGKELLDKFFDKPEKNYLSEYLDIPMDWRYQLKDYREGPLAVFLFENDCKHLSSFPIGKGLEPD
jgi:hypothetical protein